MKYFLISIVCILASWFLVGLAVMWQADKKFAYGKNLDGIQRFTDAYSYLTGAVELNPDEPTFRDELSYNQAVLALALIHTATASAQQLVTQAIENSNKVVETSPNSMPFWKTRTKVFYQLATIDDKYYLEALSAIKRASELAPTDAKVSYNLAILYGRVGQVKNAIATLEETIKMKEDYRDAYYALGLYYKETGDTKKARVTMEKIIQKIGPDAQAQKWLEEN